MIQVLGQLILSSPDDVKCALPIAHIEHCIFNVHGDYLETRIRNTPDELKELSQRIRSSSIDRIFDELGLIICGWSADWAEWHYGQIDISCSIDGRFSTSCAEYGHAQRSRLKGLMWTIAGGARQR